MHQNDIKKPIIPDAEIRFFPGQAIGTVSEQQQLLSASIDTITVIQLPFIAVFVGGYDIRVPVVKPRLPRLSQGTPRLGSIKVFSQICAYPYLILPKKRIEVWFLHRAYRHFHGFVLSSDYRKCGEHLGHLPVDSQMMICLITKEQKS